MLVSVLIPCFNAEKLVGPAIDSALAQSWPSVEVLVVDDGSTDGSLDVIRSYGDRVHWETGPNRGGGYARNRLLELAKGDWIQYLDADDLLFPEKITRQLAYAAGAPEVDIIFSPTMIERCRDGLLVREEVHLPVEHDPWVLLPLWELPQTGGPLFRRTALTRISGWRTDQPCCQEHELYLRLLIGGVRCGFLDENLSLYRVWDMGSRLVERMVKEVPRQRLLILQRMEDHLRAQAELTSPRLQAINDTRHRLARMYWLHDRKEALRVMRSVVHSDPAFVPSESDISSLRYRWTYRLLGFQAAEGLAALARKVAA